MAHSQSAKIRIPSQVARSLEGALIRTGTVLCTLYTSMLQRALQSSKSLIIRNLLNSVYVAALFSVNDCMYMTGPKLNNFHSGIAQILAEKILRKHSLIEEEEVECRPEKIPNTIVGENFDVYLVRKYFSSDAWLVVEDVIKCKSKAIAWVCQVCQKDLHTQPSITCDSCLTWYHLSVSQLNNRKQRHGFVEDVMLLPSWLRVSTCMHASTKFSSV